MGEMHFFSWETKHHASENQSCLGNKSRFTQIKNASFHFFSLIEGSFLLSNWTSFQSTSSSLSKDELKFPRWWYNKMCYKTFYKASLSGISWSLLVGFTRLFFTIKCTSLCGKGCFKCLQEVESSDELCSLSFTFDSVRWFYIKGPVTLGIPLSSI